MHAYVENCITLRQLRCEILTRIHKSRGVDLLEMEQSLCAKINHGEWQEVLVNRQQMHRQLMEKNENVKVPSLM